MTIQLKQPPHPMDEGKGKDCSDCMNKAGPRPTIDVLFVIRYAVRREATAIGQRLFSLNDFIRHAIGYAKFFMKKVGRAPAAIRSRRWLLKGKTMIRLTALLMLLAGSALAAPVARVIPQPREMNATGADFVVGAGAAVVLGKPDDAQDRFAAGADAANDDRRFFKPDHHSFLAKEFSDLRRRVRR